MVAGPAELRRVGRVRRARPFPPARWQQTWRECTMVTPALAERHRVIATDLRGLGDSARPDTGYDTLRVAADSAELPDHLDIARFGLAGHDLGAMAAYAYRTAAASRAGPPLRTVCSASRRWRPARPSTASPSAALARERPSRRAVPPGCRPRVRISCTARRLQRKGEAWQTSFSR
jgi:pimeloyl-ACP methyl ester carboxylesterase